MVFDREYAQVVAIEHIDESVRGIDSPTPCTLQPPFQRFGFADSLEWGSQCVANERIDSSECPSILRLPIQVVVPRIVRPTQHGLVFHEWVRGGAAAANLIHAALDLVVEIRILINAQRLHERVIIRGAHHHHIIPFVLVGDQ